MVTEEDAAGFGGDEKERRCGVWGFDVEGTTVLMGLGRSPWVLVVDCDGAGFLVDGFPDHLADF